jgi:putative lipoprotein
MIRFRSFRFLPLLLLFASCSVWAQVAPAPGVSLENKVAQHPVVSGTIAYFQRIALPPNAAIEVKVQDVTDPAHPVTIASTVFGPGGQQVPIPFQLNFNPTDINPAHTYQVQANISVNGRPMFVTPTPLNVITQGAPSQVSILLQPPSAVPAKPAETKLRNTHWVLSEVSGQAARPGQGETPHLVLHKKGNFSGSTGCNRLAGNYIASMGALQFTPGPMTMRACADPIMQQEQAIVSALKATTGYKIDGSTLELRNGDQILAKFQAEATQ